MKVHRMLCLPTLAISLLLHSGCRMGMTPPPAVSPAQAPDLLGCEASPRPTHCPPAPCKNTPVAGIPVVPFSCPGNGWSDATEADIGNLYDAFHRSLRIFNPDLKDDTISPSDAKKDIEAQEKLGSEVQVIEFKSQRKK